MKKKDQNRKFTRRRYLFAQHRTNFFCRQKIAGFWKCVHKYSLFLVEATADISKFNMGNIENSSDKLIYQQGTGLAWTAEPE